METDLVDKVKQGSQVYGDTFDTFGRCMWFNLDTMVGFLNLTRFDYYGDTFKKFDEKKMVHFFSGINSLRFRDSRLGEFTDSESRGKNSKIEKGLERKKKGIEETKG